MNPKNSFDKPMQFDNIGYWSEVKLEIIRAYAQEYSRILSKQRGLKHVYIDAFAGAGRHLSRKTEEFVSGSPLNALAVEPPFKEFYLIDVKAEKAEALRRLTQDDDRVHVFEGDCNEILLRQVLPHARFSDFRRGLCLLDPYGLHLDWKVLRTAGEMKSIEIFLNFPTMDMHRNVFWHNPEKVRAQDLERMNRYWGDSSWRDVVYDTRYNLFQMPEKVATSFILKAFRDRLRDVAGFAHVLDPIPLRNSLGIPIYYLYFASPKPVAKKIVEHIFGKYRTSTGIE